MPHTQLCTVLENAPIAQGTHRMVLAGDTAGFAPGRFVNVQVPGFYLRRPLAICDYTADTFTLIYRVVGEGTKALAAAALGAQLDVLAPLGNGFCLSAGAGKKVLLAGGGVGLGPLYALAKQLAGSGASVHLACGFNTASEAYLQAELAAVCSGFSIATVDGSEGVQGLVTHAVPNAPYDYFYACGPTPMLKALCAALPFGGEVSLEERMACGFGGCMGCAIPTADGMKRVCKDGPVFRKEALLW